MTAMARLRNQRWLYALAVLLALLHLLFLLATETNR